MVDNDFPRKLRVALAWRGHTAADLARHMDISPQAVAKYTQGRMLPNSSRLVQMAAFLGVSMDYLVSGDDVTAQIDDVLACVPVRKTARQLYLEQMQ